MLEFQSPTEFSAWIKNHSQEKETFQKDGRLLTYHVLANDADPEMPVFFGFDSNRNEFYVSSSVPQRMHRELILMEDYRLHFCEEQTYKETILHFDYPKHKRRLIVAILKSFFMAISTLMEETQHENHDLTDDIKQTLALLRQPHARKRAA